jgi:ribosome-binding factor A
MRSSTEPSQRQRRVGEQIRHIVAETLQRGHFRHESLSEPGNISVTEVRISPDLKHATAFVMSLGGAHMDKILPALNECAHIFQKDIAKGARMKFTPRIKFMRDESFDEAKRIEDILRDIQKTD